MSKNLKRKYTIATTTIAKIKIIFFWFNKRNQLKTFLTKQKQKKKNSTTNYGDNHRHYHTGLRITKEKREKKNFRKNTK